MTRACGKRWSKRPETSILNTSAGACSRRLSNESMRLRREYGTNGKLSVCSALFRLFRTLSSSLFLPAQPVVAAEAIGRVFDHDFDDAIVVAGIDLFDDFTVIAPAGDRGVIQFLAGSQRRIEWEEDFIPWREVALRLSVPINAAAFQVTEMPDIVRRRISPHSGQWLLPLYRQRRVLLEERIEGD